MPVDRSLAPVAAYMVYGKGEAGSHQKAGSQSVSVSGLFRTRYFVDAMQNNTDASGNITIMRKRDGL